jgi:hypothetical protein
MTKIIYILLVTVSITNLSFSQENKFTLTKEGLTDFIVTPVENKTAIQIYNKTIEWISKTYKDPKEVIKAEIINDYIRIEAVSNSLICINAAGSKICNPTTYMIEISVKDGKYKFDVLDLSQFSTQSNSWFLFKFDAEQMKTAYDKKGELKKYCIYYPEIPEYFNSLNESLKNFILEKNSTTKKDW